jgi:fructose-1,6-bisphosphatase/inositol monophosphatase family enzyme
MAGFQVTAFNKKKSLVWSYMLTSFKILFAYYVIRHMYSAIKGHGAFLNGTKSLKTSNRKSIKESMILLEMPTGANETKKGVALANMTMFMEQAHAVRCPGPAATDIG